MDWRVGASGDAVLILGSDLPWIDGLVWLGRDPRAPELLLPTRYEPPVHPGLIARRLGPVAMTLDPARVLPISATGRLHGPAVERWLDGR